MAQTWEETKTNFKELLEIRKEIGKLLKIFYEEWRDPAETGRIISLWDRGEIEFEEAMANLPDPIAAYYEKVYLERLRLGKIRVKEENQQVIDSQRKIKGRRGNIRSGNSKVVSTDFKVDGDVVSAKDFKEWRKYRKLKKKMDKKPRHKRVKISIAAINPHTEWHDRYYEPKAERRRSQLPQIGKFIKAHLRYM